MSQRIIDEYKRLGSVDLVVRSLDLPREEIADVVRTIPSRGIYLRRGERDLTTEETMLTHIRLAAEVCGEPLTIPGYRRVAPEMGLVSDMTITHRLELPWHACCARAGVSANLSKGLRTDRTAPQDCYVAIRRCADELGHRPSYPDYNEWARKDSEAPGGSTVRLVCDGWTNAVLGAFTPA